MTFGYSTNAYTRFNLLQALEMIADIGFAGVEIMCDQPHLYPPEWPQNDLAELKKTLAQLHLKVTNLNSFTLYAVGDVILPSWIEADPAQRQIRIQHTENCLRLAAQLGCKNISIPPGGPAGRMLESEALALFRQGLEQVIPLAEALDVLLLIEPEPFLLIENTPQSLALMQDIRSDHVGLNFDIGHFFCAGENPATAFDRLFQWVGHVHIEDIAADRSHNHLIPGLGAIHFTEVLQRMATLRYRGDMTLELYPYVAKPTEAGSAGRRYLLPILEELNLL
jgi:sugar phosphate isomerase/epimerase